MAGIRLTTLGRSDLTTVDGGVVLSVLAQPKRFALLVYLAVEGSDGLIRRDAVAALFWPEQDQADARANLRKSLHFLRKSLGQDVIVTRGDEEVGVDSSLLECDAVAILSGGTPAGDGDVPSPSDGFLEGFHFSGAPNEWEDWAEGVRQRLRARVAAVDFGGPGRLGAPGDPGSGAGVSRQQAPGRASFWRRLALGTSVVALILLIGLSWILRMGTDVRNPVRYDRIVLGSGLLFPRVVHRRVALPPEGAGILFFDTLGGSPRSWWKPLNQPTASPVTGLDRAVAPTFSPTVGGSRSSGTAGSSSNPATEVSRSRWPTPCPGTSVRASPGSRAESFSSKMRDTTSAGCRTKEASPRSWPERRRSARSST